MPYASGEAPIVGDYAKNQWEQPGSVLEVSLAGGNFLDEQISVRWDDRRRRHMPLLFGAGVSLLREPHAANPHVRFDEREQETEPCQTGLRWRGEDCAKGHWEATATAPVLDFTNIRTGSDAKINFGGHGVTRDVRLVSAGQVRGSPKMSDKCVNLKRLAS